MLKRCIVYIAYILALSGCLGSPVKPEVDAMNNEVRELNAFRNAASARCSGASYSYALGRGGSVTLSGEAAISEKLLEKGYGTGKLDIGVTLQEKTELASLLGNLTNEQVERFLDKYKGCMNDEMEAFYKTIGLINSEKQKSKNIDEVSYYGAFALGGTKGVGWSTKALSLAYAEDIALERCGDINCKILFTVQGDECGSLAWGKHKYIAKSPRRPEAQKAALQECNKYAAECFSMPTICARSKGFY